MKKALALVLALVLALSMAVTAFALDLKDLTDLTPADPTKKVITVVDADDKEVLYTDKAGTYYIALTDEAWTDVKVTANGYVSAKLIDFDPDTMEIVGNLNPVWAVTEKGVELEGTYGYEEALAEAARLNNDNRVTYYGIKLLTHVNVIEITVHDNYGVKFETGSVVIDAKKAGVAHRGSVDFVIDVTIFEYEQVKWAAENFATVGALECGDLGYSDYFTAENGYGDEYVTEDLRNKDDAAVVSTTAFRAIEGKNLLVACDEMTVVLNNVVKGQKGVNFKHYGVTEVDTDWDGFADYIKFGFLGEQKIAGDFKVVVNTEYTWYTLREAFGEKIEEDDIVYFYVYKDGKYLTSYKVDYKDADYEAPVVLTFADSNAKLGNYEIRIEALANEVGEENPNTGAESVVGVVAALAVVSVATAAAVSLKK